MRRSRTFRWKCAPVTLAFAALGYAQIPFPAGVELTVRGPDGHPIANSAIVVTNADRDPFHPDVPVTTTTDAHGIARFQVRAGVSRLLVAAPHIGYGTVGLTEFVAGKTVSPHMAPLVAYGSLDGKIPPEARKPDVIVTAGDYFGNRQIVTTPDPDGHFHFADVISARWHVWSGAGKDHDFQTAGPITVLPGQAIRNITLAPSARRPPPLPPEILGHAAGSGKPTVWARGTVRDDRGHPIPNATVYGLATYFGGRRMNEAQSKTITGADGSYVLEGEGDLPSFSATVVATAPGWPPAWAWISSPMLRERSDTRPPTEDLVLTTHGCTLQVTVLRDGKPAAGVAVGAYRDYANLRAQWALPLGNPDDRAAMEDAAYPIATTGLDGIARFDRLLPGSYRLIASAAGAGAVRGLAQGLPIVTETQPYGIGDGIAVRMGRTNSFQMAIERRVKQSTFRILRSDGTPLAGNTNFNYGNWSTSIDLDQSGMGRFEFASAGLWRIEFPFPGSPLSSFPTREPYFLAAGTLAASNNLDAGFVPSFTARRIEPASARIQVEDAAGKPLRAAVQIERITFDPEASGETDESGSIRFAGLFTVNDDVVRAFAEGFEPVDLGDGESPLPAPEQLRNRMEILAQPLATARSTEARIVLRAEPVGYAYGSVRIPAGQDAESVHLYLDDAGVAEGAWVHLRPSTGEFAAGPFRPGTIRLRLAVGDDGLETPISVTIRAGEATPVEMDAPAVPPGSAGPSEQVFLGMGGISAHEMGADSFVGRVFLSDGVTPAAGALALFFKPGRPQAIISAIADALGNLQAYGTSQMLASVPAGSEQGPASPVVVAFLPGACGAAIQPMQRPAPETGEPMRLVLPAPVTLRGRVATATRAGTIRVLAAYRDRGFLNAALSVQATADAAGNFTLAGLTPGTYQLQAALDEIWLSPAVTVRVADRDPAPVNLAIAALGAPLVVHLEDRSGKPVIGGPIAVDQPAGPLAEALWPGVWTADGAGIVFIPTLEAGLHTLRGPNSARPTQVHVPALPASPVEVRMTIDEPAHPSAR
jgi:hypothetical protein